MTTAPPVTPSNAEVLRLAIENRLMDMFVAMPCTVEKYYPNDQSADLRPRLPRILRDDIGRVAEALPNLPHVPVLFPGGSEFFIKFALKKGDTVLVVVCDRDIGPFLASPAAEPVDDFVHGLMGAVCFPVNFKQDGAGPFSHLAMGSEAGKQIHIKEAEVALGSENPSDFVVLANKLIAAFNSHTHPATPGPTSPPTTPLTLSQIASSVVKSE